MDKILERKSKVLSFLRKVSGTDFKEVTKEDAKDLLQKFNKIEPLYISLNHTTIIKCFKLKNKFYRAYYNLYEHTIIDEILLDKY